MLSRVEVFDIEEVVEKAKPIWIKTAKRTGLQQV